MNNIWKSSGFEHSLSPIQYFISYLFSLNILLHFCDNHVLDCAMARSGEFVSRLAHFSTDSSVLLAMLSQVAQKFETQVV